MFSSRIPSPVYLIGYVLITCHHQRPKNSLHAFEAACRMSHYAREAFALFPPPSVVPHRPKILPARPRCGFGKLSYLQAFSKNCPNPTMSAPCPIQPSPDRSRTMADHLAPHPTSMDYRNLGSLLTKTVEGSRETIKC
jgi:hypothetical protein